MLLVPSISVIKGRTTRLRKGDFDNEKVYDVSPLEITEQFVDHGVKRIHLVDLQGAKAGNVKNFETLQLISGYTDLSINFTGGIHTDGEVGKAFEYGAESITSGTVAATNKELFGSWIMSYGREKIALGADVLGDHIKVGGWQKNTQIELVEHISYFYERGLKYLKTTDISKEGTLEGPAFDLYERLLRLFPDLCIFASGGVRHMDDIKKLEDLGLYGVIFGKAFYERRISLKELENYYK